MLSKVAVDSELVQRSPSVKTAEISKYDLRDVFTGVAIALPSETHALPILLKVGMTYEELLQVYIGYITKSPLHESVTVLVVK